MLLLGMLFTLQVVFVFGAIGLSAGFVRERLLEGRSGPIGIWSNYLVAGIFTLLALRLLYVSP
jgi:hypothetical protein